MTSLSTMAAPLVSIIVPTFNEAHNVSRLVALLDQALDAFAWEVVFVDDDSPDGTWKSAQEIARQDRRVRCIRRIGRRGLAGACIEGVLSSSAPYVAIMDADLQHDETILPTMFGILERDEADIAVASRHTDGGDDETGFSAGRAFASRFATGLAATVIGRDVSDPMSGFFAMKREAFERVVARLQPSGFKILLDILASADPPLRVKEVGYRFRTRQQGQSKFDLKAMLDFLSLLVHRVTRGLVPVRFLLFAIVGASGVGVHLAVVWLVLAADISFQRAQVAATIVAMTSNFFINNLLTYRDQKLRGFSAIGGLLRFYVVCSVGAVANVGVASYMFGAHQTWWISSLAGIVVGTAFNYTMSSLFVWRRSS